MKALLNWWRDRQAKNAAKISDQLREMNIHPLELDHKQWEAVAFICGARSPSAKAKLLIIENFGRTDG